MNSRSNRMRYLRRQTTIASVIAFASCWMAGMAHAQDVAPPAAPSENDAPATEMSGDIVVTASRTGRSDVPTPVLAVNSQMLTEGARTNVVAVLNDLPQFKASFGSQINAASLYSGLNAVDLRGLGTRRSLLLYDGRRLIGSYFAIDASILPSSLIKRVDVVTGSASAAWGSNAVAGVVNFIFDDAFEGVRLGGQAGISSRGDAAERKLEAAFGTNFAGGRGHFIIGGEYVQNDGIGPKTARSRVGRWAIAPNPNFTPTNGQLPNSLQPDVGFASASPGGLILSGVNAGLAFNADGTLSPFNRGQIVGSQAIGGDAPSLDDYIYAIAPSKRYSALARATFDLTDSIKLTADLLYGRAYSNYNWIPDFNLGGITVNSDNAFLPASIRNQMIAAGETSFTMGRMNADYAFIGIDYARTTTQASIGFDAELGNDLKLSGHYSHGQFNEDVDFPRSRIKANFANAVDAVISPVSGLPVCRIALTNPATDCVPINLFGLGAPSPEAVNYVTGTAKQRLRQTLDTGGLTLRGSPFALWAGPVSVALGIEARHEYLDQAVGPIDAVSGFAFFNNSAIKGRNTTKEAFGELLMPVVRDLPLLQKLQFNAAARLTHDRTGSIWSWKLGAIDEVMEGVQLRFTTSRDIRAPNLMELYSPPLLSFLTLTDPQTGTAGNVRTFAGGNPALKPEKSRTTTAGITLAPRALGGLRISADYFDINIKNAIGTLTAQQIVNLCFQGNSSLCGQITRTPSGAIDTVSAVQINLVNLRTRGLDASLNYTLPLGESSSIGFRSDLTWVMRYSSDNGIAKVNYLGSQGTISGGTLGTPRVVINSSISYNSTNIGANLRARYISSGYYSRVQLIENNRIPAYTYFDAGLRLQIPAGDRSITLTFDVNNIFDKAPPIGSGFSPYYDIVGRYFTAGARIKL